MAITYQVTQGGWNVWKSGVNPWNKLCLRFMNGVQNSIYPARLWTLWLFISVVVAIYYSENKLIYDLVKKVMLLLPGTEIKWQLTGCAIVATLIWLTFVYAMRYSLKGLLMYKGWMSEVRSKNISVTTKIWFALVRFLVNLTPPKLYSLQGSLPNLPLPLLRDTMRRYLRSIRPLVNDENYERIKKLADDFEKGVGVKLQRFLILKSWWSNNYVSDWWVKYAYLRDRSPLMINSNFYGTDAYSYVPTHKQAARTASSIRSCMKLRQLIDTQELKPLLIRNCIPLCSSQYEKLYNTTRIPGIESDQVVHWQDSNHVVVYHKGRYFKVTVEENERLLEAQEIQVQIQQILDDTTAPQLGEEKLAALTAGDRTLWAQIRRNYFNTGVNKMSLDAIESAMLFVVLDDIPYLFDPKDPTKLETYCRALLHGKGYDKWFDKSLSICIGTNGRIGNNAEHAWGDGPVSLLMAEFAMMEELDRFDANGDIKGECEITPPAPVRLQWDINKDCQDHIDKAALRAQELIDDLGLRVYYHDKYGKGLMKARGLSPDSYVQMALQLAYYRDTGRFCLTYESSMMRFYRDGRTETVRSCTIESAAWVKAMEDKNLSKAEKIKLLRIACERHQKAYQDAMCGKGIDRHLFSLYVVSQYLKIDSPFLKEVFSEPWKLSTTQLPLGQSGIDYKMHPELICCGGGFGPTADDGYGVLYLMAGENCLFFHITAKNSSKVTDCQRLARNIEEALEEMKNLFLPPTEYT